VLSVFAGLRPLAAPKNDGAKTKEISRSHKVILSASNLVTITGGKWTTFRKMGEDTVAYFEKVTGTKIKKSTSAQIKFHGFSEDEDAAHLSIYGSDAAHIELLMDKNKAWAKAIHPKYPYTEAEIVFIVQNEMPVKIEDVLSRRLRILLLDAKSAIEMAPKVAEIMAREQGKSSTWIAEQIAEFEETARKYLIKKSTYGQK
jgi:glycerol-3-phosphate dehydrogenase